MKNTFEIHEAIQDGAVVILERPGRIPRTVVESSWSADRLLLRTTGNWWTIFNPETDSCKVVVK